MNKKIVAGVAVVALGIGGVSAIALQSHAQQAIVAPVTTHDISSPSDTDNIQDDQSGVDKPDAVIQADTNKETNDDATSTVSKKKDIQEQNDGTASDANEVEDAN